MAASEVADKGHAPTFKQITELQSFINAEYNQFIVTMGY
jgi:hypothetical protein